MRKIFFCKNSAKELSSSEREITEVVQLFFCLIRETFHAGFIIAHQGAVMGGIGRDPKD